MNREEHLQWSKKRALEYVDRGDLANAYSSLTSDFLKHPELANHSAISLGIQLLIAGHLSTADKMREFIEGFN